MTRRVAARTGWILGAAGALAALLLARARAAAPPGTVERIKVHGKALEGNLGPDPAGAAAAVAQTTLEPAPLSRQLAAAADRGDVPGVVAVVVDRDHVLYEGAFGRRDVAHGAPMSSDAIFRIASMTKPVTTVAAMMLVEEGRLRLDDPVSKYLPGFDHLQVISHFDADAGSYDTRPASRAMTIRHLMSHTSGIGYAFSSPIVAKLVQGGQKHEWEIPLREDSVKAMGVNQIGQIVIEQQPAADPALTKPFPLGAGHDKFGLGFEIQAKDDRYSAYRSPGSLSWAGLYNTHFWIDPARHVGAVVLMQVLPFYDDAAIKTLRDFESLVYAQLRERRP